MLKWLNLVPINPICSLGKLVKLDLECIEYIFQALVGDL